MTDSEALRATLDEGVKLRVRVARLEQLLESAQAMVVRLHGEREVMLDRATQAILGAEMGVGTAQLLYALGERWRAAIEILEGTTPCNEDHAERLRLCTADLMMVLCRPVGVYPVPTEAELAALEEVLAQEINSSR